MFWVKSREDRIELATHYPNKTNQHLGAGCNFLEVVYSPDLHSLPGLPFEKPIRGTRWVSNDHIFALPEGSLFSDPILSHVDQRIALQSTIEKEDSKFDTIKVSTRNAIEIIPGTLPDHLFWPEQPH